MITRSLEMTQWRAWKSEDILRTGGGVCTDFSSGSHRGLPGFGLSIRRAGVAVKWDSVGKAEGGAAGGAERKDSWVGSW